MGFRPREAYRHAHGWSQDEVAARFIEVAERLGGERARTAEGPATVPSAPMIGTRIGEYERWPHGGRRPSTYVLTVLAAVLGTGIEQLLDYDDHRHMPDHERTVLAAVLAAAAPPVPPAGSAPARPSPAPEVSPRPDGGAVRDARWSAAEGTDTTTVGLSGRSGTAGATVRRGTAADEDLRAGTGGGARRERTDIPATGGTATRADEEVEVGGAEPARRARATGRQTQRRRETRRQPRPRTPPEARPG